MEAGRGRGGVKGGATDLEVRAGHASGDLFEERLLDLDELRGLDHVQDLLQLPEEHHLHGHKGEEESRVTTRGRGRAAGSN